MVVYAACLQLNDLFFIEVFLPLQSPELLEPVLRPRIAMY